ncbi:MAG: VWA domain-containing protein, partial [Ignavibacteriae bacterium]|nr:VWA domain-containing protein [Ignavibacteriota bacterium]
MELNKVLLSGNIADYLFIVVLITASVFISFFYYRRTIIKSEYKAVLVSIRIISLFLLLFLLLNPFYSYLFRTDKKPVNVFLVDKSLSLNTGGRINDMKNSIKSVLNNNKSSETENMFFLFGEDLHIRADGQENLFSDSGLQKGGYASNISRSINSLNKVLSGRTINSVLIFSDGIINDGGNGVKEALESKAPYYYIIPGDTARKRDVLVKTLFFNKTAVTGFKTTISAEINSYGFDKKILVNLYENASLILSKPLELTENINRYSVDFEIKSNEASIKKYKVEIASDKSFYSEELTGNNNSEECFIKFSSRELKAIVISGSPSPDFAFFSETLRKMQDYHAEFFTQKSGGEYYETGNPDFKNADFIILFGYPTNISDNSYGKKLLNEVSAYDIPVIFIDAPGTDYENLKAFENVLPFT